MNGNPVIRTRRPGDRITFGNMRRDMKYCLRSLGIGAKEREELFYLAFGDDIAAVLSAGGVLYTARDIGAEIIISVI
jgi:hypothetical protein